MSNPTLEIQKQQRQPSNGYTVLSTKELFDLAKEALYSKELEREEYERKKEILGDLVSNGL